MPANQPLFPPTRFEMNDANDGFLFVLVCTSDPAASCTRTRRSTVRMGPSPKQHVIGDPTFRPICHSLEKHHGTPTQPLLQPLLPMGIKDKVRHQKSLSVCVSQVSAARSCAFLCLLSQHQPLAQLVPSHINGADKPSQKKI